ncbi:MAG: hypothetical protein LUE98_16935 [Tannerellaceae bacterium]|nr:hypothetical protein [Tannerellaceae bacterium]
MLDSKGEDAKELRKKSFQRITVAAWPEIAKDPAFEFPDEAVPATKVQFVMDKNAVKTDRAEYAGFHAFHDFHVMDATPPKDEEEEKDPTLYFTLDDPVGAANDMRILQLQFMGQLTGLLEQLMRGKESDAGEDLSYTYLYMQALSFYKMFHYDSEEEENYFRKLVNRIFRKELSEKPEEEEEETEKNPFFEKLKEQIADHKFFEKILLVEERAAIRDEANKVREQLARLVDSDYYRKVIDDYIENIPTRLEEGIEIITEHHKGVAWDANLTDRHMDIKDTSSPANEKIRQYMEEVFYNDDHKISQLLSTTYDMEEYIFCEKENHMDAELAKSKTDKIWYNMTSAVILWNEYARPNTKANQPVATTVKSDPVIKPVPDPTPPPVQVKPHPTKEGVFLANTKQGEHLIMNTKWLNRPKIVGRNTTGPLGEKTRIDLFNIEIAELKTTLTEMWVKRNEKTYGLGRGSKGRTGVATKKIAEISDLLPDGAEYLAIKVTSATKEPIFPAQPSHTGNALPDIQQSTSATPQTTTATTAGKANKLTREKFNKFLPEIFATKAFIGLSSIVSACNMVSIFRRQSSGA